MIAINRKKLTSIAGLVETRLYFANKSYEYMTWFGFATWNYGTLQKFPIRPAIFSLHTTETLYPQEPRLVSIFYRKNLITR